MAITVNGKQIETQRIEQEMSRLRPDHDKAFADMPEKQRQQQLEQWSKENVIEQELLEQAALEQMEVAPEQIEQAWQQLCEQFRSRGGDESKISEEGMQEMRARLQKQLKVQKLLESIYAAVPEPSQQDVAEYYQQNKEKFRTKLKLRVSHIVKHPGYNTSTEKALEIMQQARKELQAGQLFPVVAERYSDCPDKGGDLGYIEPGQMVEEFEDMVFNMSKGQVSEIFQTRFGLHIATVTDRQEPKILELEEVRDDVVKHLSEMRKTAELERYVDKLKAQAQISDA